MVLDNPPGRPEHYNYSISNEGYLPTFVNITAKISAAVAFGGSGSNIATGVINIYEHAVLELQKHGGATAWSGDINIRDSSKLLIYRSDQISDQSTVSLISTYWNTPTLSLVDAYYQGFISEKINRLQVQGNGILQYGDGDGQYPESPSILYLDELIISKNGELKIVDWVVGKTLLLVKKDSWNLEDALSRINFKGYYRSAGKREYNWQYWEIGPGFPEPATYGALFAAIGLGVSLSRRRTATRCRNEPARCSESSTE